MITIATNMAGRGTDIILGGNPKGLAELALENAVLPILLTGASLLGVPKELPIKCRCQLGGCHVSAAHSQMRAFSGYLGRVTN
jgi:preprotein translocase subunit SecA